MFYFETPSIQHIDAGYVIYLLYIFQYLWVCTMHTVTGEDRIWFWWIYWEFTLIVFPFSYLSIFTQECKHLEMLIEKRNSGVEKRGCLCVLYFFPENVYYSRLRYVLCNNFFSIKLDSLGWKPFVKILEAHWEIDPRKKHLKHSFVHIWNSITLRADENITFNQLLF